MPPTIVVVGSHGPGLFLNVKRLPVVGENVLGWGLEAPVDGGKGSNQAVAAARQGATVSFVGCVGQDALGDESLGWLAAANVDLTHVTRTTAAPTLGGLVLLDATGQPGIITLDAAFTHLTRDDVTRALAQLPAATILVTQFEIPVAVALHAARLAKQRGLLTIVNPSPAPEALPPGLEAADLLVPNETEALTLLGLAPTTAVPPAALAQQVWRATGAGAVLVTLGARGVVYAGPEGAWQLHPPRVAVVDATGAGDAFCGALAVGLALGRSMRAAARWACAAAAYTVTQRGTIPVFPTAAQVSVFAAEHGWATDA